VRDIRGLLIVVAVVVALAAAVWLVNRPKHQPSRLVPENDEPVRFRFADVSITSPDLEVVEPEVRGSTRSTYSSWLVVLSCAEPEGCAGEFAVEVKYHTGDESRRVVIVNRCEVPNGGEMRFEGLQDPSTPVDRIEGLTLEVRERGTPGRFVDDMEF
jgi:hypothetical protein